MMRLVVILYINLYYKRSVQHHGGGNAASSCTDTAYFLINTHELTAKRSLTK